MSSIERRGLLFGLASVGLSAAAPRRLPNHLFSLTVWASGRKVDFVLLNIAEQPLRVVWTTPPAFDLLVRDEAGGILGVEAASPEGFVTAIAPADLTLAEARRRARRLRVWKALKGSVTSEDLRRLIGELVGQAVTPDRRYALSFRMRVQVLDPAGGMQVATVQSRSLCTLSFQGGRLRTDCRGPT